MEPPPPKESEIFGVNGNQPALVVAPSPHWYESELGATVTQQMSPELETMPVRFASLSAPFEVEQREVLEMHAGEIMGNEVCRPVDRRPQRSV